MYLARVYSYTVALYLGPISICNSVSIMQAHPTFVPSYGMLLQPLELSKNHLFLLPWNSPPPLILSSFAEKAYGNFESMPDLLGIAHFARSLLSMCSILTSFLPLNLWSAHISKPSRSQRKASLWPLQWTCTFILTPLSKRHAPGLESQHLLTSIRRTCQGSICPLCGVEPKGCNGNMQW